VAHTDDPVRAREVREAAHAVLPLKALATAASLWVREPEGWRRLADLPLAACED